VAHELRGPLAAVATSAELLVADWEVLEPPQMHQMVRAVHRGTIWLQGLVENLLCAASISDGRFQIRPQPVSLLEVAEEVRPVVEPILGQRGQGLRLKSRVGRTEVRADPRRLGQVLINLILNASKFAAPQTPIDLTLTPRAQAVRVAVADRGPGLPEGSTPRLFEPFYRAASAVRSGPEGVGLGLAIVRWIVEAHGGQVGADNRPGGGARFWFDLPVGSDPVRPAHHLTLLKEARP
jgi:two-component system sensor histidine kinase KdpD